jgi:hypothetical protein
MKYYRVPESYTVAGDCPNCGAKEKNIRKAIDGEPTRKLTHEERLRRLKEAGLGTTIES